MALILQIRNSGLLKKNCFSVMRSEGQKGQGSQWGQGGQKGQ